MIARCHLLVKLALYFKNGIGRLVLILIHYYSSNARRQWVLFLFLFWTSWVQNSARNFLSPLRYFVVLLSFARCIPENYLIFCEIWCSYDGEYQGSCLMSKGDWCIGVTTFLYLCADCLKIFGA